MKNLIKKFLPPSYLKKRNRSLLDKSYATWIASGKTLPVPHDVKRRALLLQKEIFKIDVLVETGTYLGIMVLFQQPYFKKIISIELGDELFNNAKKKFESYSNITILHGDSGKILPQVVQQLNEPAVFFLDGHYSEGITTKAELNTPIENELKCILSSTHNHVIVVDDAADFNGKNDYPTQESLREFIKLISPHASFVCEDGLFFIHKNKTQ